jgi:DNA repair protein RadC
VDGRQGQKYMKGPSEAREGEISLLRPLLGRRAAERLLARYPLHRLLALDRASLLSVPGVRPSCADLLLSLSPLIEHLTRPEGTGVCFSCSREVFESYRFRLGLCDQERFLVLALSSRNGVLAEETVALGTVNTVHVRPADILRPAIRTGAPSIICLHNHPSGDPSPSPEDRALTERIGKAASLVGVRLLDHIVVALSGYHSFSDTGGM